TSLLENNVSPNQISLFTKMSHFALKMLRGQEKDEAMWDFILKSFLAAKKIEIGGADKFLDDYKSGFIKIMGFGDNLDEARYYLSDFDVV
ncbi:MAG: hypothetical protein NT078_00320, partial [Candidatus Azambacteria bacterium]|nr:hypothetical protein [Candidatus Azambacteria bacterium]